MNIKKFLHKFSSPRAGLEYLSTSLVVYAAFVSAVTLPFVKIAHTPQIMAFKGVLSNVTAATEKLALLSHKVLSTAIINSFTQSIVPSVRNWDSNIKKACDVFGTILKVLFCSLAFATLGLLIVCTPLVFAVIGAIVVPVLKFIDDTISVLKGINQTNPSAEPSQTENAGLFAKTLSKAAVIATHAAYAALSILCMPFMVPVYVFASTFDLKNKFNIYDYNEPHSSGIVHKHIAGIRRYDPSFSIADRFLEVEACDGYPSMSVKLKSVAADSDEPSSMLNAQISMSVDQYLDIAQEQFSAAGR
ncbi:hypothetical protein [Anaplasma bovis]|uniref:hypothetical protein n=1 Tax=Anaplasma bovis TaxID=186733 RepID=UPI002FF1954E